MDQMIPAEDFGLKDLLDANPVVGTRKSGPRRFWTNHEVAIVRERYPTGGLAACLPLLPGRTATSVYQRAGILELESPAYSRESMKRKGAPRQRHTTTEHIDAMIRLRMPQATQRNDVVRLAQAVGRPSWWVSKRAAALGLTTPRFKEPPWTEAEKELIQDKPHQNPATIQRKLAKAGFKRSTTAIVVKLKRLGASTADPDHYTATGLATLMGVDNHVVTGWIEKGFLTARRRGTERTPQQGGDQWWITIPQVRRFIIENPHAVDLRKVDRYWFIDLLGVRHNSE